MCLLSLGYGYHDGDHNHNHDGITVRRLENNCQRTCRKASQTFMSQTRWKAIQRFFCFVCATIYFFSLSLTLIVWNYMTSTLFVKTGFYQNMTSHRSQKATFMLHMCVDTRTASLNRVPVFCLISQDFTYTSCSVWKLMRSVYFIKKQKQNLYNIFKSKIKHL